MSPTILHAIGGSQGCGQTCHSQDDEGGREKDRARNGRPRETAPATLKRLKRGDEN